jgi:hypothetical protein
MAPPSEQLVRDNTVLASHETSALNISSAPPPDRRGILHPFLVNRSDITQSGTTGIVSV